MKALFAFLIELVCFVGILYYYVQNRKKERERKERNMLRPLSEASTAPLSQEDGEVFNDEENDVVQ